MSGSETDVAFCRTSFGAGARGDLKVPFARCADGTARHIDEIADNSSGPFSCLGCKESLIRRHSRRGRPHFAHLSDSRCAGETVLHQYAKDLLARAQTITLPVHVLRAGGCEETVDLGGTIRLGDVRVEVDLGDFKPDAVTQRAGNDLAVEFKVSHAVGADKRALVTTANLAMIEIDLSSIGPAGASGVQIDHAILHGARRYWIHHPDEADGRIRLKAKIAERKQDRGRRLRAHIDRQPYGNYDKKRHAAAIARIRDYGLADQIGVKVVAAHWFAVCPIIWQSAVLAEIVIGQCAFRSPESPIILADEESDPCELSDMLPSGMVRDDLRFYPADALVEAGLSPFEFGSSEEAIRGYLDYLARAMVVEWDPDGDTYRISEKFHGRVYRREKLRRLLSSIFIAAGKGDRPDVIERWMGHYNADGQSPAAIAWAGGAPFPALVDRLKSIQRMVRDENYVADDLCGLGFRELREERLEHRRKKEERAIRATIHAIEERARTLFAAAIEGLGDAGPAFVAGPAANGWTILSWAAESNNNFASAKRMLGELTRAAKAKEGAAQVVADCKNRLTATVRRTIKDETKAQLFLATWLERCDSPPALIQILKTLAAIGK